MELVWGEICAVLEGGVCCKPVSGNGGGVGGGNTGEQRDDIKADHDVVWLEGDILDDGSELVRVLYVVVGVPHQGVENLGEMSGCVVFSQREF